MIILRSLGRNPIAISYVRAPLGTLDLWRLAAGWESKFWRVFAAKPTKEESGGAEMIFKCTQNTIQPYSHHLYQFIYTQPCGVLSGCMLNFNLLAPESQRFNQYFDIAFLYFGVISMATLAPYRRFSHRHAVTNIKIIFISTMWHWQRGVFLFVERYLKYYWCVRCI